MTIATMHGRNGKTLLVLGLTRENITKLMADRPMFITRAVHGSVIPQDLDIAIVFAETEHEMFKKFKESGNIGPDTKIQFNMGGKG